MMARAASEAQFDIIIIGGGATGLGCAVDAATRGHSVLLLERFDFAKGTSSRSTKLIHGGVRYLQQGNVSLVMESLKERGILRRNAPHLVRDLAFVVPNYDWWEAPFYGIGMKVYDMLAGKYGFGGSSILSKDEAIAALPTIETEGLRGGVRYHDGQFDDARLAINLATTAASAGATLVNYADVVGLHKEGEMLSGVRVRDQETGRTLDVSGRAFVNATGAWSDGLRQMDEPDAPQMIRPSRGVHVVLPRRFLPGDSAIMVPHTKDGRVLFAIPWHDRVVVGTTDTPVEDVPVEPRPSEDEIHFILEHARQYLSIDPDADDVCSVFAGVRPLVSAGGGSTASISRDHTLHVGPSGLITIAGGKWTTYRKMAEDTVDHAQVLGGLESHRCVTKQIPIHGSHPDPSELGRLWMYGADAESVEFFVERAPNRVHPHLDLTEGEVTWMVRTEMAQTVDDVLARRSRSLLLDARAARDSAQKVAELMAKELNRDAAWIDAQVQAFAKVAEVYVPVALGA